MHVVNCAFRDFLLRYEHTQSMNQSASIIYSLFGLFPSFGSTLYCLPSPIHSIHSLIFHAIIYGTALIMVGSLVSVGHAIPGNGKQSFTKSSGSSLFKPAAADEYSYRTRDSTQCIHNARGDISTFWSWKLSKQDDDDEPRNMASN